MSEARVLQRINFRLFLLSANLSRSRSDGIRSADSRTKNLRCENSIFAGSASVHWADLQNPCTLPRLLALTRALASGILDRTEFDASALIGFLVI